MKTLRLAVLEPEFGFHSRRGRLADRVVRACSCLFLLCPLLSPGPTPAVAKDQGQSSWNLAATSQGHVRILEVYRAERSSKTFSIPPGENKLLDVGFLDPYGEQYFMVVEKQTGDSTDDRRLLGHVRFPAPIGAPGETWFVEVEEVTWADRSRTWLVLVSSSTVAVATHVFPPAEEPR